MSFFANCSSLLMPATSSTPIEGRPGAPIKVREADRWSEELPSGANNDGDDGDGPAGAVMTALDWTRPGR